MAHSFHRTTIGGIAALVLVGSSGCGGLPNQNTIPPNIRLTYYVGGKQSGSVDQTNKLPAQHVPPGQLISISATGFSSLVGMQSIEIDATNGKYGCINGSYQGHPVESSTPLDYVNPVASNVLKPVDRPTLVLETDLTVDPSANSCSGTQFASWTTTYTAIAVSKNGLKTTSQSLTLICP